MNKLLSFFFIALLLPMSASALTLEPNQRIMGHYTTDDLALGGCWGKSILAGVTPIATDIMPEELAAFQGSKIVAFRVGLSLSTPVSRVFVTPVAPDGTLGDVTEWACNVSDQGWNMIELETPYTIDLPNDYSLRIGFDYLQSGSAKPISAVKIGKIYPTLCYFGDEWLNMGVNVYGNLSLQCITQNEHYPQGILWTKDLTCNSYYIAGDDLNFSFQVHNLIEGQVPAGRAAFEVALDGNVVTTISNPEAITSSFSGVNGSVSTAGLAPGEHTLSVTVATINGEPVDRSFTSTTTFKIFDYGFPRQMRLVEQFTSTWCTHCPTGTANIQGLCNLRDDIAWVAIHQNMTNTDPFRTLQCDSIDLYQDIRGYPEGTFDRSVGISSETSVAAVLTSLSPAVMSSFLDYVASPQPSWATVNVNSTYDTTTRQAVITIDGQLVPDYEDRMGTDSRLTVYITEDGLVGRQTNGGDNYVHNHVLRQALVSVTGVALKKMGDAYKNVFNLTIPEEWNADNLNIVAFVSRPLRPNALTDIYVTNANKRKLGECDEPAILRGDADGDGEVTIGDVTVIIDMLLAGSSAGGNAAAADCDMDGEVTIADVTDLIDYLLSGQW